MLPWPLVAVWVAGAGRSPESASASRGRTCRRGRWAAVDDPAEGGTAAAAINTVQLICGAFGAGLAGVVVNMTDGGDAVAARWLFAVFAVLAAGGLAASYRASRGR